MIETITLITLSLVLISILRPGKTPPLDSLLIIERPGRYYITLAPKLNLAQPFIEEVAQLANNSGFDNQISSTQYFEVKDNQVTSHGYERYLLAITFRNGLLYFQADSPHGKQSNDLKTISGFADSILAKFPVSGNYDKCLNTKIVASAQKAAELCGIQIKHLQLEEQQ